MKTNIRFRVKLTLLFWLLLFNTATIVAQTDTIAPKKNLRKWGVAAGHAAIWTGAFIALDQAWYANYEKDKFHFYNDNKEWLQMDKWGHIWTANQLSRFSTEAWKWSGMTDKQSIWLGGISGWAFQSVIEIQDGFSKEWGFSWGDMLANTAGSAAFVAQRLTWGKERIIFKLSYTAQKWNDPILHQRSEELFGTGISEKLLKDYNAQTYWVSANIHSFLPESKLPKWLNLAFGYGAKNMLGGYNNTFTLKNGNSYNYNHLTRERIFYLSPDIDFTRIPTQKKWLRAIFFTMNMIKMPAPALSFAQKSGWKWHWIRF